MAEPQDLTILSLQGGENNTDPPNALLEDECVLAENVEFFYSTLGERRLGMAPLGLELSGLQDEAVIVHLSQWFPENDVLEPQFFAIGATPNSSATVSVRTNGIWSEVPVEDALNTTVPAIYQITTQSLNGLLFVAYRSAVDRMHVYDGATLRRAGLAQPDPVTATDTAVAGTYAGVRYFRTRIAEVDGDGVILRLSEPSESLAFTPAGTFNGAIIAQPAVLPNEGETNWIVEASEDDSLYYWIANLPLATTTYTDTTAYAAGYSDQGPLSPQIGDYDNLPSAKFIAVDGDRLVFGSHWTDPTKMSQIGWTPVQNSPGYGNSQRLPLDVDDTTNLDNFAGGPLTGIIGSDFGTWYAFKFNRIYRMMRTGSVDRAYDVICLSTSRGAVEGSLVRGFDESGSSCIYFLDPMMGPSRIGTFGIQVINGQRGLWGTVNLQAAAVVACGCFYPYKQQVHWWVTTNGDDRPNYELCLQVSLLRAAAGDAVRGGWSRSTGLRAHAVCATIFTETVSIDGIPSISERPFIGMAAPNYIQRCDVENTDNGTVYYGTITTRPYMVAGLLNQWGAMVASLMAAANSVYSITVKLIKDFGVSDGSPTTTLPTSLAPVGSETMVIKKFDDLVMSEAVSIQVMFTDAP